MADYKTRIGQVVGETFESPEKYADRVLPLLAMAEVIATRGESPGTSALGQQQAIYQRSDRQRQREQEELERTQREKDAAIQRRLTEFKMSEAEKESQRGDIEQQRKQLDYDRADAFNAEVQQIYENKSLDMAQVPTMINDLYRKYYPKEYAQSVAGLQEYEAKRKIAQEYPTMPFMGVTPGQTVNTEQEVVKMISGDQRVKDYNEIARNYNTMKTVWNRDIKSGVAKDRGAIDQALITLYNKMLDPGSVVRESEYARTPEGLALVQRIEGFRNRLMQGGPGITDALRDEMVRIAGKLHGVARGNYQSVLKGYQQRAQMWGARPEGVFDPEQRKILNEYYFSTPAEADAANLPKGTTVYIAGRPAVIE